MTYAIVFFKYILTDWIQDSGSDLTSTWLKVIVRNLHFCIIWWNGSGTDYFSTSWFMSACHFCYPYVTVPLPVSFELGEQIATLGKYGSRVSQWGVDWGRKYMAAGLGLGQSVGAGEPQVIQRMWRLGELWLTPARPPFGWEDSTRGSGQPDPKGVSATLCILHYLAWSLLPRDACVSLCFKIPESRDRGQRKLRAD